MRWTMLYFKLETILVHFACLIMTCVSLTLHLSIGCQTSLYMHSIILSLRPFCTWINSVSPLHVHAGSGNVTFAPVVSHGLLCTLYFILAAYTTYIHEWISMHIVHCFVSTWVHICLATCAWIGLHINTGSSMLLYMLPRPYISLPTSMKHELWPVFHMHAWVCYLVHDHEYFLNHCCIMLSMNLSCLVYVMIWSYSLCSMKCIHASLCWNVKSCCIMLTNLENTCITILDSPSPCDTTLAVWHAESMIFVSAVHY